MSFLSKFRSFLCFFGIHNWEKYMGPENYGVGDLCRGLSAQVVKKKRKS
jgi:hypothetical protein